MTPVVSGLKKTDATLSNPRQMLTPYKTLTVRRVLKPRMARRWDT